jgi:type II secretory pathway pseudopilin PulG
MELLIVVALMGLIATAVVLPVNAYYQRSRVEGAANDVRNFLVGAQTLALSTNSRVTVTLQQTGGLWTFSLTPASPPPAGSSAALTRTELELPAYIVVTGLWLGSSCDWPLDSGIHSLVCDTMSRTLDPTTGQQLTASATVRLTHVSIAQGRLSPPMLYEVRVAPLWSVAAVRMRR